MSPLRVLVGQVKALQRDELGKLVGLLAATAIGFFVNMYASRHYARWDVTEDRRYTLSAATKTTLRELREPVEVWVLLGAQEPLKQSVSQILTAYAAESSQIVVKNVDPDKDPLAFEDVRKRFRIEAGRAEDGRRGDRLGDRRRATGETLVHRADRPLHGLGETSALA